MPEAAGLAFLPPENDRSGPWVLALAAPDTEGREGLHWTFETREDAWQFVMLCRKVLCDG